MPANGTWGNLAKNAAGGPALWQDDATIEKMFRLSERNSLIFRAEAFNLFNRAQYGILEAVLTPSPEPSLFRPALASLQTR